VNFHKYHALFSMRLLQLDWTITSFVQDGFWKCSLVHTKLREWLQLWHFYGDTAKMAMIS
jgi:hypothetical protein